MSVLEWILGAFGLMTVSKHLDEMVQMEAEYIGKLRIKQLDLEAMRRYRAMIRQEREQIFARLCAVEEYLTP